MRKTVFMLIICIAGTLLNYICKVIVVRHGDLLYLDTIFTVAVTFIAGPLWGSLTGALTNLISNYHWFGWLFAICNIATALITWLFIRLFPRELDFHYKHDIPKTARILSSSRLSAVMDRMIVLFLLSFALCLAMSILGGLIAAFIDFIVSAKDPEYQTSGILRPTLFNRDIPVVLAEILSRIPINIIDRLITAFAGYGAALVIKKSRPNFAI